MKKSVHILVILIIFGITSVLSAYGQTKTTNESSPQIYPLNPSPTDTVYIYYSYVSNDGCPDYYFRKDSVSENKVFVSLLKITDQNRICTQAITKFTAKLILGTFKTNTDIYLNGNLLGTIKVLCVPDKEGVIINCNGNLFVQEMSPLAIMQLYVIKNTSTGTKLNEGDKVKFGGQKIKFDPALYPNCSVVGIADCITLIETPPVCVKDRKGVVVTCNRALYIKEIIATQDSLSGQYPKLFEFENTYSTDASGITKTALSLNDRVIFGAYIYEKQNTADNTCTISGKVKCYEVIYDAPECELNKEGIVVKCNETLFIEEFSIAAVAIKQLHSIKINSNIVLKVGDRVKFGGYSIQNDSIKTTLPCGMLVGVALCAKVIETTPPPCIPDLEGTVVACGNELFIREATQTADSVRIYRLFAFDNSIIINTAGNISRKLILGDKVKFAAIMLPQTTVTSSNCPVIGKVSCLELITAVQDCVLDRKGKVITCNNQLLIAEYTNVATFAPVLYTFRNNGTFDILKDGDVVVFGVYGVRPDSASVVAVCPLTGVAQCWKIIETTPQCVLNRNGVIEQGVDGCNGNMFIREFETRKLFRISIKDVSNTSNVALTGLKPGYKVIFGGYLTQKDSNVVGLCNVDGVALCLQIVDTNIGCELNRKGIIVKGSAECADRYFVRDLNTGNLYLFYNYDGIYRTENYTAKLNPGDLVIFGAVDKNVNTDQYDLCKIAGVIMCYELVSSAKTFTISGYAVAENEKLKAGRAVLLQKGGNKALAVSKIADGYFKFNNIPASTYTIYVIPAYPELMKYVPTFYIDKLFYRYADFIDVKSDVTDVFVKMRSHVRQTGNGKIYGNIHYETGNLNDTVMVKSSFGETYSSVDFNLAVDVPVLLLNIKGETVAWTVTDTEGNYVFENIPMGTFKIYSETSTAIGDQNVEVTTDRNIINANLVMKNSEQNTGLQNNSQSTVILYPNPVKDKLTIILTENETISLFDIRGQLLYQREAFTGLNEIDLTTLQKGVLLLKTPDKTFKLIKE